MRGDDFDFLYPGLVRIKWPEKSLSLEPCRLEREYQKEYLSKFYFKSSFFESVLCYATEQNKEEMRRI
jgi:hypothetical protein